MSILENALTTSIIAVIATYLCNLYKDSQINKKDRLNLLNSLLSEAIAIQKLIAVRKKDFRLDDPRNIKDYGFAYFPISYNYFSVYENSASKIGILEDPNLINYIICSYADVKGLFENLKDLAKVSDEAIKYITNNPAKSSNRKFVIWHYSYSKNILEQQVPIVEEVLENLVQKLQNEISMQENRKWWKHKN